MRRRSTWMAGLVTTGALALAPVAMASIPFSTKGEIRALDVCAAAGPGAQGQAKWDGPKFEIRFVIPNFANKSVDVKVNYAGPEINQEVTLDARGEGSLKVENAPTGPREIQVDTDGGGVVLLTSDGDHCAGAV